MEPSVSLAGRPQAHTTRITGSRLQGGMSPSTSPAQAESGDCARHVMTLMVVAGLVLSGVIQQSSTVALMALSDPLSSAEFAEYVANTSYVTRYCDPINHTKLVEVVVVLSESPAAVEGVPLDEDEYDESGELLPNDTIPSGGHGRHIAAEPHLKVPLSEEESVDSVLREVFLWGSCIAPLPASRLAARVGPRLTFGVATLANGLLLGFVPLAWFTPYHTVIRFLQGIFTGSSWPALHMLAASWFPPLQTSSFVSCYSAVSIGYAVAGLAGTPLVQAVGRDPICYMLCALSATWFLAWLYLVQDKPHQPSSLPAVPKEQPCTAPSAQQQAKREVSQFPWRHLLSSAPVWACAVASLGNQWGQMTLQLAVTKYLKLVYGFSLTYDRVLSVLPHIGHFMAALLFGRVVDHVRAEGIVSTTTARKLFVYISHFFPAAFLFVVGYSACDPAAPAAMYTAAVIVSGATPTGSYCSALDLAPNYAGTIFGLSQTLGAAGSLIASYVITEGLHGSLPGSWRLVFGVASGVLVVTAVFFMAVGSGSVQSWNNPQERIPGRPTSQDLRTSRSHSLPGEASPHAAVIAQLLVDLRTERRGSLQYCTSLEAVVEVVQAELEECSGGARKESSPCLLKENLRKRAAQGDSLLSRV
ncbi:sialin-like [Bacillus rossius redtenbacheri]|uniref:sialin-like n=1 Tax=Bacillus rossius redtenbacheri TaxID=93214 RepID=UPI002FDE7E9F